MRMIRFAVLLLLTLSACAAEDKYVNELYDLQKIADGVYSFIAPESDSGVVQSNCTVIIGENAVLVVDTGQFPSLADRMVADLRRFTRKPVRYVVNTHWHFDHSWGNAVFRDTYPGVAIISTEFTRELIEDQGRRYSPLNARLTRTKPRKCASMWRMANFPTDRCSPKT